MLELIEGWDPIGQAGAAATVGAGYGWSFAGSTIEINNTQARNGALCLRIGSNTSDLATYALSPSPVKTAGFAFKTSSVAAAQDRPIGGIVTSGGVRYRLCLAPTNDFLQLRRDNTVIWTDVEPIALNVYAYYEISVNRTSGRIIVRRNNTERVDLAEAVASDPAGVFCGSNNTKPTGYNGFTDDIYAKSDGVFLGDSAAAYVFPTSDNTPQDWVPSVGPDGFQMLNNLPPDNAQYVEGSVIGDISNYNFPAPPPVVFAVHGITTVTRGVRTGAGIEKMATQLVIGGTPYQSADYVVPQTTPAWHREIYPINPATTMPWQPADVASGFIAGFERKT